MIDGDMIFHTQEVPERQRGDAADSLVYEANLRLQDPVYGCVGVISTLQQQIQSLQAELNAVRAEILKYNYREACMLPSSSATSLPSGPGVNVVSVAAPPPILQPQPPPTPQPSLLPHATPSSSVLAQPTANRTADFGSISSENNPYFGYTSKLSPV